MKTFLKTRPGKICAITVAVVLLAVAAAGGYQYWHFCQPKFQDVTIELGTASLGLDQFTTQYANIGKCGFVSDVSTLDIGQIGVYELTLRHGKQEQTVTLTVQDTTAPVAEFHKTMTQESGYVPYAPDFVVSSSDLSPVEISFAAPLDKTKGLDDMTVLVAVTDAYGNTTQEECILSFSWIQESVQLEYGTVLTKLQLLLNPGKDSALVDQAAIDAINAGGPGVYTVESTSGNAHRVCTVTVADTLGPVLELQNVTRFLGKEATQEDFILGAEDPSGVKEIRMITELDCHTAGQHTIVFEAEDNVGNISKAEAIFNVVTDMTPPKISGMSALRVEKGSTPNYMAGVSANDEIDGYCSVSYNARSVDTSKPGFYYVTYTATDKSGNTASVKRSVEVLHDAADTQALVAQIAASLPSDPEALRDYVRNKITYSTGWGGDDPVWYGFKNRMGNCYVHALCLRSLLQYYGYSTQLIWVKDKTHYWLLINLGGSWYHIDPTPSRIHSRYSLMTDEQRYSTLSGRDWDRSKWPTCG